ncbi:MAG: hypothetical protein ACD_3C00054G0021 [uncultured bacterium (gcode 4)]|uniref:Uncharacterized protein n=1 Tax=uncultured bacterium (gcode 4) TaxID=1234023 RepID=K2FBH4_9BACT|nr:MAG: hypothetical protein ACD_3C00054G0021 [uncultured bacterium (gcode 4)]
MSKNELAKPKKTGWDIAYTMAKATLSAIPILWWPATELFSAIISPPIEKRKEAWIESIVDELKKLVESVEWFKIENLVENQIFVSTMLQASQIAIKNHQKEKLDALRNMVINTAQSSSLDEDSISIYLNLVDILTPWHIKILTYYSNPTSYWHKNWIAPTNAPSSISGAIGLAFPELRWKRDFLDKLINDLVAQNLIKDVQINTMMTSWWVMGSRITEWWNKFLKFITEKE